jgi:serine/threonine-protein kinase
MTSSIPLGTLLRQRYLIQQILGQGGFGRTYLALDQERFNEPCVLKEFVVSYRDQPLIEKAKTLFQREASTLYQIQHPQVPRFWAVFEDNQRLFLVQDFVDGLTYRSLLKQRQQQKKTFSEQEILHFLGCLLPVLGYIHDRDIIHRDISPENVMLRIHSIKSQKDRDLSFTSELPVLIDFGAVKEVASYLSSTQQAQPDQPLISEITRVGKAGYAPPEQLQTGKVYPHSDLYSLAVTSLVLLTGKEPLSLLDSQTLTWQWQSHVKLSDRFSQILQKMLALRPGDRYPSAWEVQSDLQPLLTTSLPNTLISSAIAPILEPPKTAINSPVRSEPKATRVSTSVGPATLSTKAGFWSEDNLPKTSVTGAKRFWLRWRRIGLSIAIFGGISLSIPLLWYFWKQNAESNNEVWVSGTKLPQSEASQILTSQREPLVNPNRSQMRTRSPEDYSQANLAPNNAQPQTIQLDPGKVSTTLSGNLPHYSTQPYRLRASGGQIMTVTLQGPEVVMNLLGSNQQGIDVAAYQTRSWTGQLPASGYYLIQVLGSGSYSLDVALTPSPSPTLNPNSAGKARP